MTVAMTSFSVALPRTISSSFMTLAGEKEVHTDHVAGPLRVVGDLVDVEARGVSWPGWRRAW